MERDAMRDTIAYTAKTYLNGLDWNADVIKEKTSRKVKSKKLKSFSLRFNLSLSRVFIGNSQEQFHAWNVFNRRPLSVHLSFSWIYFGLANMMKNHLIDLQFQCNLSFWNR